MDFTILPLVDSVWFFSFIQYLVLGNEAVRTLLTKTVMVQEVRQLPDEISAANTAGTALNQQPWSSRQSN